MVIVCPECTTKFKVNEDRIPDSGAKVRCARCKHIFWVGKPTADEPSIDAVTAELSQPEPEPAGEESAPIAASDNGSTAEATPAVAAPAAESGFDYDQFREQDTPQEEESFSFSGSAEEPIATTAPESAVSADEKESFSFGEAADQMDAETDNFLRDEAGPSPQLIDEESTPEPRAQATAAEKPKSSAFSSFIRILLLLILSILIIGGVLLYMNGPEQLEQVIQQMMGQQSQQPAGNGQITLDKLQGKFLHNQDAGELFVIRGEAINKFNSPRASVQVKGVIFDQNGKSLLQKTIFCGNPISDTELQTLTFDKIEELMGNQFGKSLSNLNINKDQSIPFVIVFRDLPQSLSEFSVDVTSSKPVTP